MRRLLSLAFVVVLAGCAGTPRPALEHVDDFQLDRYLGTWHQIATIPAWFQDQCVGDAQAVYALDEANPGLVVVTNSCRVESGATDVAEGRARFVGPPSEGRLEVTFISLFGHWIWPIPGGYVVVALDPDYRWVLVGHPTRDYAWILARDRTLPDSTLLALRQTLQRNGYDPCRLLLTEPGRNGPSLCTVAG
ncbi:MAG: lipocalin family protein [Geminicoccaceae bacterium]